MDIDFEEPTEPEAPQENDAGTEQMAPPTFLRRVEHEMAAGAGGTKPGLNHSSRGRLAKFWYGEDGSIHYEIWVHERSARFELGLHCESTSDFNRTLYKAFDSCMIEIQEALGTSFWLEEWDHGWVRLYETHPLYPLDEYRVAEVVGRLGDIINTLQPIYEEIAAGLTPPIMPVGRQRR